MQAVKKVPNRRVTASRSARDKEAQNEGESTVYSESLACWHMAVWQCAGCIKMTLAWTTTPEAVESTVTQPPIFDKLNLLNALR